MRTRTATAMVALGLTVSACGSPAGSGGPSTHSTRTAPSSTAATGAWVRIADPSGVSFEFPSAVAPTVSTSSGSTTRTYIANAGGDAVASIVIIPTPVALDVKNFFVQYPIKLKAQGNTSIKSDGVRTVAMQGFKGFQTTVTYIAPPLKAGSAPSYVVEEREAIQMSRYFVVISAVAGNSHALTSGDIAQANAVNAHLLRSFRASTN